MMNRIATAILCGAVLAVSSALADELQFGSPAPPFSVVILHGEPIDGIREGTVYVVEFGGTMCAPCIKLIPEMNSLQERFPEVVFVSVFCERLKTVKPFMEGTGKTMRVRVGIDEAGRMQKNWVNAGGLEGVPQAFIVDHSGRLAWFGNPTNGFGEILEKVVDRKYDGRLEAMRLELQRKLEAESLKDLDWVERVNKVSQQANDCETPEESIAVIDKAFPEFARSPERIKLSIMKLGFYQKLPQSREQGYRHALTLAVEAVNERNPHSYVYACEAMLYHCESALPENVDNRLADLALAVLLDETAPTNHVKVDPDTSIDCKVERLVAIAHAHRIRGERTKSLEQLADAITILKNRELKGRPRWWLDEQKQELARLESMLSHWKTKNKMPFRE